VRKSAMSASDDALRMQHTATHCNTLRLQIRILCASLLWAQAMVRLECSALALCIALCNAVQCAEMHCNTLRLRIHTLCSSLLRVYKHMCVCVCMCVCACACILACVCMCVYDDFESIWSAYFCYVVASVSSNDKTIGLFCKISL